MLHRVWCCCLTSPRLFMALDQLLSSPLSLSLSLSLLYSHSSLPFYSCVCCWANLSRRGRPFTRKSAPFTRNESNFLPPSSLSLSRLSLSRARVARDFFFPSFFSLFCLLLSLFSTVENPDFHYSVISTLRVISTLPPPPFYPLNSIVRGNARDGNQDISKISNQVRSRPRSR